MSLTRLIRRAAVLTVLLGLGGAATANAAWTTYRGDAARSGIDTSSGGRLPFAPAWTSPTLNGSMWGQPVIDDGLVVVGTEADQVYALNEATGAVVWQASAGTPVPSSKLPCGDISPNVGITSTPVIDPATGRVLVVADTWDGANIVHKLYAFNLANGSPVAGFPVAVDPPGSTPANQLQRAALALDGNQVVIGYGGNDGDCGSYHGWLVGASESGGALRTFEVDPGSNGGAVWGAGDGPAVDSAGDIWAATGNGFGSFGYQESVLDLGPGLGLNAFWAPSNWQSLDSGDTDLGSTEPLLLPDGLVFDIGKAGVGYLLRGAALGGEGANPAFQASVCSGSYGGAIYTGGVIYVACSDGLRALALNPSAPSFSPLPGWQTPSSVNGPPIAAGGLIWATDWHGSALYGLNPSTGQPVVTQSTPSMNHFVTPSASDGKVFLGTGDTVEAYTVASPVAPAAAVPAVPAAPARPPARCTLRGRGTVVAHQPRRRRHARPRRRYWTLAVTVRCTGRAQIAVTGTIRERVRAARGRHRVRRIRLGGARLTVRGRRVTTVRLRVPVSAVHGLRHRLPESARIGLTATSAGGTSHAGLRIRRLRLARGA